MCAGLNGAAGPPSTGSLNCDRIGAVPCGCPPRCLRCGQLAANGFFTSRRPSPHRAAVPRLPPSSFQGRSPKQLRFPSGCATKRVRVPRVRKIRNGPCKQSLFPPSAKVTSHSPRPSRRMPKRNGRSPGGGHGFLGGRGRPKRSKLPELNELSLIPCFHAPVGRGCHISRQAHVFSPSRRNPFRPTNFPRRGPFPSPAR